MSIKGVYVWVPWDPPPCWSTLSFDLPSPDFLGFGVPYFKTFFFKGNHYEIQVYAFFSLVT